MAIRFYSFYVKKFEQNDKINQYTFTIFNPCLKAFYIETVNRNVPLCPLHLAALNTERRTLLLSNQRLTKIHNLLLQNTKLPSNIMSVIVESLLPQPGQAIRLFWTYFTTGFGLGIYCFNLSYPSLILRCFSASWAATTSGASFRSFHTPFTSTRQGELNGSLFSK